MKRTLILMLAVFVSLNLFANEPLKEAVAKFNAAKEVKDYFKVLNCFERILQQSSNEWIPNYYAAMCLINIARNSDIEKVDNYCDKADEFLKKADELSPNNSEILCVKAFSASTRIMVDYMERGFKYVTLSNALLDKAESLDVNNPRVLFMKGMNTLNMPAMFGGGNVAAKPYFEKALKLFNEQIEKEEALEPHWGRDSCNEIVTNIKKMVK